MTRFGLLIYLLSMKINVVYFASLISDKWESIIYEQLSSLKKCGLYDVANNLHLVVHSDLKKSAKLKKIISEKFNKVNINGTYLKNEFEYYGIKKLYDISNEDDSIVLYFHTKGMTSSNDNLRKGLFNQTINKYKQILDEFEKNPELDLAAACPHKRGFAFYNFFWVRSEYVKKYCTPPLPNVNRFYWEEWVGTPHSNKKDIVTYSPIIGYNKITNKDELYKLRDEFLL